MAADPTKTPAPDSRRRFELATELIGELAHRVTAAIRANRGIALTVAGLALVLFAVYIQGDNALSLPLFIIGGLMMVRGVFGNRVTGNLTIDWGAEGTVFSFETRIAPPRHSITELPAPAPSAPAAIEGKGETIEIEVARLNELLDSAR